DRQWTLADGLAALPLNDPSMEDAIRRSVRVGFSMQYGRPMPEVTVTSPPCHVVWQATLSTPGRPIRNVIRPSRQVACNVGETASIVIITPEGELPDDATTATVTLAPSQGAAENSTHFNSY